MSRLFIHLRRHWQALLVMVFLIARLWRGDFQNSAVMWITAGLGIVGMAMNLLVILVNAGMPAKVTSDEIPDGERLHYHSISQSTRLAVLSDWIPVGSLLMSPGDLVLLAAVAILLVAPFVGL